MYINVYQSEIYVFTLWVWKNICVFISNSFCIDVLSNGNVAVFFEIEDFQLHSKRQHRSVATMSSAIFKMNNHETLHTIYLTLSFWAAFKTRISQEHLLSGYISFTTCSKWNIKFWNIWWQLKIWQSTV